MHEAGRVKTLIRLPLVKFIVYCTHNLAMTSTNKIFVPFVPKFLERICTEENTSQSRIQNPVKHLRRSVLRK